MRVCPYGAQIESDIFAEALEHVSEIHAVDVSTPSDSASDWRFSTYLMLSVTMHKCP